MDVYEVLSKCAVPCREAHATNGAFSSMMIQASASRSRIPFIRVHQDLLGRALSVLLLGRNLIREYRIRCPTKRGPTGALSRSATSL